MSAYSERHWRRYERDVERVVLDSPSVLVRQREVFTDKFRSATPETLTFVARVEQFRISRTNVRFDEKGTSAIAGYILIGVNNPVLPAYADIIAANTATAALDATSLKADEIITDQHGNQYRVMTPTRFTRRVYETNLELLG